MIMSNVYYLPVCGVYPVLCVMCIICQCAVYILCVRCVLSASVRCISCVCDVYYLPVCGVYPVLCVRCISCVCDVYYLPVCGVFFCSLTIVTGSFLVLLVCYVRHFSQQCTLWLISCWRFLHCLRQFLLCAAHWSMPVRKNLTTFMLTLG